MKAPAPPVDAPSGPWASVATSAAPPPASRPAAAPDGRGTTPAVRVGGDLVDECGQAGVDRRGNSVLGAGASHGPVHPRDLGLLGTGRVPGRLDLDPQRRALPARAPPTMRVMIGRPSQAGSRRPRTSHGIGAPGSATGRNLEPLHHRQCLQQLPPLHVEEPRVAVDRVRIHVEDRAGRVGDQVGESFDHFIGGAAGRSPTRSPARRSRRADPATRGRADSVTAASARPPRPIHWTSSSEASRIGAVKDPASIGAVGRTSAAISSAPMPFSTVRVGTSGQSSVGASASRRPAS
jgi:hypothetical protein